MYVHNILYTYEYPIKGVILKLRYRYNLLNVVDLCKAKSYLIKIVSLYKYDLAYTYFTKRYSNISNQYSKVAAIKVLLICILELRELSLFS